jgi:Helicase HerA, central domain
MSKIVIPEKVFDQHTIALGKTGAGKSSALRYLVEHLLDDDNRVVVVTAKSDWWGLKLAADGRHAGYPVVIFGGDHQDMPLSYLSGKTMAELLGTGQRSAVMQMRDFMPSERAQFWIDFSSNLFRLLAGKMFLVIDEVHNFAPKGKTLDVQSAKMLHWTNKLASEARGLGITLIAASQRAAKVHNDFLTSCETLIAMRLTTHWDREAVEAWISGCGDEKQGALVLNSLAQMKRGDAWVWSPEIEFGPEQVHFPMFSTYDSFKPQAPKEAAKLKGWADVNLDDVREKLATVVKEAEANDPAKLKLRIRELQKQIDSKMAPARAASGAIVNAKQVDAAVKHALREAKSEYDRSLAATRSALREMAANGAKLAKDLAHLAMRAGKVFETKLPEVPTPKIEPTKHWLTRNEVVALEGRAELREPTKSSEKLIHAGLNGDVSSSQKRILNALAEFEALGKNHVAKPTIAAMARASYTSSAFGKNLGALRSRGYISYPVADFASLTNEGRAIADPAEPPSTPKEMLDRCARIVSAPQAKILTVLHSRYPDAVTKEELASLVGASLTSSAFDKNLGALRTAKMIEYPSPGQAKCAPWLHLE